MKAIFKNVVMGLIAYLHRVILSFTAFSIWPVQIFTFPLSNS